MTYVKIWGVPADQAIYEMYGEDAVENGVVFFGNRDYGFMGKEKFKEIYEELLDNQWIYTDGDYDINLEYVEDYWGVDEEEAKQIADLLNRLWEGKINYDEGFAEALGIISGEPYKLITLRGSNQGEWIYCAYPVSYGEGFSSVSVKDYLDSIFWGDGVEIEISEDDPTFKESYWDYITIPSATDSEIEQWLKDNYGEYKIVDEDDDYSWWDDYHDDTQWDNTDYDFESVRRKPIKESYDDNDDRGGYSDYERGYEDGYADGYEAGKQSTAKLYGEGCGNKKTDKKKDTKEEVKEDLVNGHRITGDDEIKEIYLFKYPDDELGEEINDGVTLNLLWNALNDGEDIYDIIGIADSVIRERIFLMLSKCFNVKYSDIYDLWLAPVMVKNLYKSFTQGYLSADEYRDAISKLDIPEQMRDTFLDELS